MDAEIKTWLFDILHAIVEIEIFLYCSYRNKL